MKKQPVSRVVPLLNRSEGCPTPHKKPLHEKIGLLGRLRGAARGMLFRSLEKLASTDDARAIQVSALRNLLPRRPSLWRQGLRPDVQPYPDLGTVERQSAASLREDVIIITARFRSGSTLLWNLFRNLLGYTAYYEPFNERRWFDAPARGSYTDPTHRKVEDYWREYDHLSILGNYYREDWIDQNLLMDADSWDPAMKRYVEVLIDRAPGRPVLQFNRIDFRLPWFRHHFPRARIVHLYRHPRDQWWSSLVKPAECPRTANMAEFARHDHYYLRNWARDLRYHFPFLEEALIEHPYQMFYYLWKLSYLFGRCYAHHCLAFEDLVDQPEAALADLFRAVQVRDTDLGALHKLIDKPKGGRWRDYADEAWFRHQEAVCEGVLADFLPPESRADDSNEYSRATATARVPASV